MSQEQGREYYEASGDHYGFQPSTADQRVCFIAGCEHAHPIGFNLGKEEGKKEGWNEAIEVCAKIAWQYRHQIGSLSATLNDELQKLRK